MTWEGLSPPYATIVADHDPANPTDLAIGTAAEHLVVAELLLAGYRAFRTEQVCPYDVAVDLSGHIIRVQVKSARTPRKCTLESRNRWNDAYMWSTRRSGKRGQRAYADDEFDVLALVALDIRAIAYLRWTGQQHIQIPAPDTLPLAAGNGAKRPRMREFATCTFAKAVADG